MVIAEHEETERNEAANAAIENADYPETTQNTRKARP
jgi:hypothetical protein